MSKSSPKRSVEDLEKQLLKKNQDLNEKYLEIETLLDLTNTINSLDDLKSLFFNVLTLSSSIINSSKAVILLKNEVSNIFDVFSEFNLEEYNHNFGKKLELFFNDTSKEVNRLFDKLNAYSKEQNFEEAQKIKNYLFLLQNFLEFNSFREKISSFDKQTFKILENLNIEISNTKVNLKIELSDEDIEFLKIHPDNDTLANFYSELLLILRFIRNKEAYTIGR